MTHPERPDRRTFLGVGAATVLAAALPANAAEFGLAPGDGDQTAALQAALDACAASGETLVLPAGLFRSRTLRASAGCRIVGTDGTLLRLVGGGPLLEAGASLVLRRLMLVGAAGDAGDSKALAPLVTATTGFVEIDGCTFGETRGDALQLRDCTGTVRDVVFTQAGGRGLSAQRSRGLTVTGCRASRIATTALHVESIEAAILSGNALSSCLIGIEARGPSLVTGNTVFQADFAGLMLGDEAGSSIIHATNNLLRDCGIGIAVAPRGDDIVAGMNTISGAKEGGLRAVSGGKTTGRDISQGGSEAYLNLTAFANVVR